MAIVEVVKYNGPSGVFAWKYPSEDLATWSQLIVNESQEAVLYKGGKALDIFSSGRYVLDTKNIPLLNKVINLPFGGRSPFSAEVWFVNKAFKLDVPWGTATPIQVQDPKYGVFIPIRANGAFGVQISDTKRFLVKLVGTVPVFDEKTLVRYFRGLLITKVKDTISSYVIKKGICVLELNAYIDELSSFMKERIEPEMTDYGIALVSFYVNEISVPDEDPAVVHLKRALAKKAEMDIIGYNYQQERSFDTMESAAKNEGSGVSPFMGAGMGMGIGAGLGGAFAQSFSTAAQQMSIGNAAECPKCHAKLDAGQRFCGKCGFDTQQIQNRQEDEKRVYCIKCGTENKGTKFCMECGKKYNPCPKCGADMEEGAASCKVCGYKAPGKCPKCGAALAEGAKFCPECGESVAKSCPKCGTVINGDPHFCPECGEKLK